MSQHRLPGRRRSSAAAASPWRPVGAPRRGASADRRRRRGRRPGVGRDGHGARGARPGARRPGHRRRTSGAPPRSRHVGEAPAPGAHRTGPRRPSRRPSASGSGRRGRSSPPRPPSGWPPSTPWVTRHTRPGGNKPRFAPSATRTRGLVSILVGQQVDVVGLQGVRGPQRAHFQRDRPAGRVHTGSERGHDSIAYRTGRLGARRGRDRHHPLLPW